MKCVFLILTFNAIIGYSQSGTIYEYDAKGCLWPFFSKDNGKNITNQTEFESAVRKDASRKFCLKNLEKIDFKTYILVGHVINSGHCRRPPGLNYFTEYFKASNTLYLNISYEEAPDGATCRARSQYGLWLLVPKLTKKDVELVSRLNTIDNTND